MFKDKFKSARLKQGWKQSELAKKLNIKNTTISNWEKGISKPDFDTIEKLCHLLNVDANYFCDCEFDSLDLSLEEIDFIKKLRRIPPEGKEIIHYILEKELARMTPVSMIKEPDILPTTLYKYIDCYPRVASCGTGEYIFDGIYSEQVAVDEHSPADFAIGVNGNSMEPTYYDGQILLIKKQDQIHLGERGLFIIDGEAYIKELGKNKLISHNKHYQDIVLSEEMMLQCVGKVIGTYAN